MKRIGFLNFGHWSSAPGSQTPTARETLRQTVELAQAAEEVGIDGAYVRVHHFARQLSSPFPLLAAMAQATERIEIGTGVIDMRYENPYAMAENAAVADLISGGRLQLGLSRGSPNEPVRPTPEAFAFAPTDVDGDEEESARRRALVFQGAISGEQLVDRLLTPASMLELQPQSPGLARRIWWGAGTHRTAEWAAQQGFNLQSSTLVAEYTGEPFHEVQAEQIRRFRAAWAEAGHDWQPRVSVSRSVIPITTDVDRAIFGVRPESDTLGHIGNEQYFFGRSYMGDPDVIAQELSRDTAVLEADTVLLTVPNQLGVEYNAQLLDTIARHIAPAIGWQPAARTAAS